MPLQKIVCTVMISTTNPISLTGYEIEDIVITFLSEMCWALLMFEDFSAFLLPCRYCESRRRVLLQHVHEGYEKDLWEYIEDWRASERGLQSAITAAPLHVASFLRGIWIFVIIKSLSSFYWNKKVEYSNKTPMSVLQSVSVDRQNGTEMYSILQAFCGDSSVVCFY